MDTDMMDVPETTIERLPAYLRSLVRAQADGVALISSSEIAEMAGTNAAQVRKDLSYLGELGTRGIGYDVLALLAHLMRTLGVTSPRRVCVIGYGRLGSAFIRYIMSEDRGFAVVAVLDADPSKIGILVQGVTVRSIHELESVFLSEDVDIAAITTPGEVAQSLADRVTLAGVCGVLNFAPVALDVPEGVSVRNVDLLAELLVLSFHLRFAGPKGHCADKGGLQ